MNEARRLGTCTDTLTRREKNDSLALSSTATTYVGFSVLPRSINIKSECAAFSIFVCSVRRSIHVKRLTAKHSLGLRQWKSAITIYTYIKESFVYTSGRCSVYHYRPKPCIRVKAHSTPLPCYGIRPNPCLCTVCGLCEHRYM